MLHHSGFIMSGTRSLKNLLFVIQSQHHLAPQKAQMEVKHNLHSNVRIQMEVTFLNCFQNAEKGLYGCDMHRVIVFMGREFD